MKQHIPILPNHTRLKPGNDWEIVLNDKGDWEAERKLVPVPPTDKDYEEAPYAIRWVYSPDEMLEEIGLLSK